VPSAKDTLAIRSINGRNPTDPPHSLPNDIAQEVQNIDFYKATLGRKRPGSTSDTAIFAGATFLSEVGFIQSHMPDDDFANREVWAMDDGGSTSVSIVRRHGATVTTYQGTDTGTVKDPPILLGSRDVDATSFNGKFYICYECNDTDLNRTHLWAPSNTQIRRVGMDTGTVPTADTGLGTGDTGLNYERFYKLVWAEYDSSTETVIRRGEASAALTNAGAASATAIGVSRPALPGESETHWELYADTGNTSGTFYRIATVAAGSTTYADNGVGIASYNTNPAIDDTGTNTPPKNARYVVADESRLLFAGNFIAADTAQKSEIEFTPRLGDADKGDDERIVRTGAQTNRIRLGEGNGSGITGLAGPIFGSFFAFKRDQTWKLVPTGLADAPYRTVNISKTVGCIDSHSIVLGRDNTGQEALYWMSEFGPYRYGGSGIQYLGHSVEDKQPNLGATGRKSHALYLTNLKQVWFWVATGTSNDPNVVLVFDVMKGTPDQDGTIRKGWAVYTGGLSTCISSDMAPNTPGASASAVLRPYMGSTSSNVIVKGNDTTVSGDSGTGYQALIKLKALDIGGLTKDFGTGKSFLLAKKGDTSVNIDLILERDFGVESRTFTVDLAGDTQADRVVKTIESDLADASFLEIQIGDTGATTKDFQLDALEILITKQGTK